MKFKSMPPETGFPLDVTVPAIGTFATVSPPLQPTAATQSAADNNQDVFRTAARGVRAFIGVIGVIGVRPGLKSLVRPVRAADASPKGRAAARLVGRDLT
jgi:hypothetical protein